jgi:hypothetical protein
MLFVERYVTTLDDLECLLLLIQTLERWWDAESIARERHVQVGMLDTRSNASQLETSSRFESPERSVISIYRGMMHSLPQPTHLSRRHA